MTSGGARALPRVAAAPAQNRLAMHNIMARLHWTCIVGVLGGAAVLATTGCTKVSTSIGAAAHGFGQAAVLRISDISDPSTLNPMLSGADVAYQLSAYTLEYLVQLDDSGHVIPVLCERVPTVENGDISPDGLTLTYHLRRGVTWSDGVPFTAQDVIASWKQVMNPLNNVIIREGYDVISQIDAPNSHTAVVHLKRPYAPLPTRFFAGIQEGPIAVMPAHVIADLHDLNRSAFNARPIGTGPFIVQSWERNGRMVFVANPHYWRGKPGLEQIVFQAQPSTATEFVGFQTHEIDTDFDAGPGRLPEYQTLKDMRVVQARSLRLSVGVMNCEKFPFSDIHVRHALAYAIDRAAVLHNVYHDAGYLADEYLPRWSWAYTPDVPHYPYDVERSRSELDAAGYKVGPDGIRYRDGRALSVVLVTTAGDNPGLRNGAMVQSFLHRVGFAVTIKTYPYGLIFDNNGPIRTGNYNLAFYSFSVNYDPSSLDDDGCDQFAPHGGNDARFCDRITEGLERQGLAIPDVARRKPIYQEIERRRMSDLPDLPMYFRDRVSVVTTDLHGYTPSNGIIPQWNAWQWTKP
ncbi:MAG TPA: peptide ABC transporter substrate-binding protein [Candidatus Eremiobacteraceae bacterium]|nr:peptide ABC transporter substrate-binding protein [Candidatus Eremiobacteraceae bacterium]